MRGFPRPLACIQGSDAHALAEIGRRSTRVDRRRDDGGRVASRVPAHRRSDGVDAVAMTSGAPANDRPGALARLRVLDLSRFVSGPYATKLLADYGADVVKVEPPDGDPARARRPVPGRHPEHRGERTVPAPEHQQALRHVGRGDGGGTQAPAGSRSPLRHRGRELHAGLSGRDRVGRRHDGREQPRPGDRAHHPVWPDRAVPSLPRDGSDAAGDQRDGASQRRP